MSDHDFPPALVDLQRASTAAWDAVEAHRKGVAAVHDPTDPRKPPRRQEQPRHIPPGWQPYPPGVNPSQGVPGDDRRLWWRLQPGQRGGDGGWVRRGIVHGGTCARWPTGRAPADWTWHNRPQVRQMLDQAADFIPCPVCCVGWLWAIWPREGSGPRDWPTAEV